MRDRWYGIDYLRAAMSIAVVAWHLRIFGTSELFDLNGYPTHHIQFSDIINFNLLLLAVPTFFLISIFLQVQKWMNNSSNFRSRIERLTYRYIFWTGIFLIVCKIESLLPLVWPDTGIKAIFFVISGGGSWFYFLFSLLLLTVLSNVSMRLTLVQQKILVLIFLMLLWIFPAIVACYNTLNFLTAFWNPLNFFVYIYISQLIYLWIGNNPDITHSMTFKKTLILVFLMFIISALFEWIWFRHVNHYNYNGYAFPSYTRVSVVLGATFLFLLSFTIRKPPGSIIKLLSDYSFGLYCLHIFVGFYYYRLKSNINLPMNQFFDFVLILVVSLSLSIILRRAFLKGLI